MVGSGVKKKKISKFQLPSLIEEVKNILQLYPDDGQIFKEIIQNADDAGAKEVVFIYNQNDYTKSNSTQKFCVEKLSKFQGPTLYAYNDAVFQEKDWQGITSLSKSNKRADPLKVGRFGLGFKSVFNITDLPSIASGSRLLFLDPLRETLQKEIWDLDFEDDEDLFKLNFGDVNLFKKVPPNYSLSAEGKCEGSLFCFPLRTKQSDISEVCYGDIKIQELIKTFKSEGCFNLIFLKSVQSITMYQISQGCDTMEELYSVRVSTECAKKNEEVRQKFIDEVARKTEGKHFEYMQLDRSLVIEEHAGGMFQHYKFMISELFGCANDVELIKLVNNISYAPLVAVAMPMENNNGGHVFCGLPLPLNQTCMTGLPIHVNGFFGLGPDRKDLKWKEVGATTSNDEDVTWNLSLIKKLIPIAYLNLLKFIIRSGNDEILYNALPDGNKVNEKWKVLLDELYQLLQDVQCIYLPKRNEWLTVQNVVFVAESKFKSTAHITSVQNMLERLGKNVARAPQHVVHFFEKCVHLIHKKTVQNDLKRYPQVYMQLPRRDQSLILESVIENEEDFCCLFGNKIWPLLCNNYGEGNFMIAGSTIYIPTENHKKELLPNHPSILDVDFFNDCPMLLSMLKNFAKTGRFNLKMLDTWQVVLQALKISLPKHWTCVERMIKWEEYGQYGKTWLSSFWRYQNTHNIPIAQLQDLPLIPVTLNGTKYLHKVGINSVIMVDTYNNISSQMKSFLEDCGIVFFDNSSGILHNISGLYHDNRVLQANSDGIIRAIENVNRTADEINQFLRNKVDVVREELKDALEHCNPKKNLPDCIYQLNLLREFSCGIYVSIMDCRFVEHFHIPKIWQQHFAAIIDINTLSSQLVTKIKNRMTRWSFEDVIREAFSKHSSESIRNELSDFVLKHISNHVISQECLSFLKDHVRIKNTSSNRLQPCTLFEATEELKCLFFGENEKFPDSSYNECMVGVKMLGLKTSIQDVTYSDITHSIGKLSNIAVWNKDFESIVKKVRFILDISDRKNFQLKCFKEISWLPVQQQRVQNYPNSLEWFGNDRSLRKPSEMSAVQHARLVGSNRYVVESSLSAMCLVRGIVSPPPLEVVVKHLKTVISSYDDDEKGVYKTTIMSIYEYLHTCDIPQAAALFRQNQLKIWQDKQFVNYEQILLNKTSHSVTPYYQFVSDDVRSYLEGILKLLGCDKKSEIDIYVDVLEQLRSKYETGISTSGDDLHLAVNLIRFISDNIEKLLPGQRTSLCILVDSPLIKFCRLNECYFHDFEDDVSFSSLATHNVLHRLLDAEVARKLGLPDLVSEVVSCEGGFESWGQHEPLTLRLNRLLDDYQDGLAIPKELIQNADDAGATEVCFLYDKRENNAHKRMLIDRKMKEWQGPALWVYNNKVFQEEDFQNITKLNAGTKKADSTKIGRFGLGFNAVYHLTDVPSFFSGEYMVIFDPHAKFLGKALKDKTKPGIRIPVCKRKQDLANFNDQFQVYHGVFGVQLDFLSEQVERYDGTLFRLPLRNASQARESKINHLEYNEWEMSLLLKKLEGALESLLLFTQNVVSIKVFELHKNAVSPDEKELLFSVDKSRESAQHVDNGIMKLAANVLNTSSHINVKRLNVSDNINIAQTVKGETYQSKWLVSSSTGGNKTMEFARNHKGFSPCSGVALQYQKKENSIVPITDNKIRYIFCFLPLPEKSHMPVHLNAAFDITKDRKGLSKSTEDEKRHEGMTWNDMLCEDAGLPYFNLLTQLKKFCPDMQFNKYLEILPVLPLSEANPCLVKLVRCLMDKLLHSLEEPFPIYDGEQSVWKNWRDITFFSEDFPCDLKDTAVSFMNRYYRHLKNGKVCVNLPYTFMNTLKEVGLDENIKANVIPKQEFYKLFFQHIKHSILSDELRNEIMHCILNRKPEELSLRSMIETIPCIPSKPSGFLQLPSYLVETNSKAAELFGQDEVNIFPSTEYDQHSSYLKDLGMNSRFLSWEMILNRAESIQNSLAASKLTYSRSRGLLSFIKQNDTPCPDVIKHQLLQTSFLIVKQKPDKSIFTTWHGDSCFFGAPNKMFLQKYLNIVSCSALVCEDTLDETISNFFNLNRIPEWKHLEKQVLELIQTYRMLGKVDTRFVTALESIYTFLTQNGYPEEIINELSKLPIVFTQSDDLVIPVRVYVNLTREVPGYRFKLPSTLRLRYLPLMKQFGVKEDCNMNDHVDILKSIKDDYKMSKLPQELLDVVLHEITPYLDKNKDHVTEIVKNELFLPDRNGVMQKVTKMCFNDLLWMKDETGTLYCHKDIPASYCLNLGIKTLRSDVLQRDRIGLPFGQHEELTTRIKNLLRGYTDTEDILNEILQNADDAGATEVDFILDLRNHGTEKVFSDEWKQLQGPALLVSNDGEFTEDNLRAIQALGEGNKSDNPLKTGKFGVGFNAVYHITECPSFLTSIEGRGDVLCVFDPNLHYADGATKEHPGFMIQNIRKKFDENFTDVKSAYLIPEFNSKAKTLFRFPLRNADMAKKSSLSQKEMSISQMEKIIKNLKTASLKVLLFLHNVKSLSFSVIPEGGRLDEISKDIIVAKPYNVDQGKMNEFKTFSRNLTLMLKQKSQLSYNICITHQQSNKIIKMYHWNVVEQYGFSEIEQLPPSITDMLHTKSLLLAPRGGIASLIKKKCKQCIKKMHEVRRNCTSCNTKDDMCYRCKSITDLGFFCDKNGLFCTLPLPEKTDMPVLINGNFVLNYETRRNLWSSRDEGLERKWNSVVLTNCVLPCYVSFVEALAEKITNNTRPFQGYYVLFPKIDVNYRVRDKDPHLNYWDLLKRGFYQWIYEKNLSVLPVKISSEGTDTMVEFCKPQDEFLLYPVYDHSLEDKLKLLQTLQWAFLKVDTVPNNVVQSFKACKFPLTVLSPQIVRDQLRENACRLLDKPDIPVDRTVFKTVSNVVTVLEYCLKSEIEGPVTTNENNEKVLIDLEGIPLCVLANDTMTLFSKSNQKFGTRFGNLIQNNENLFVHSDIWKVVLNKETIDVACFKAFTLDEFSSLLDQVPDLSSYKNSTVPIPFSRDDNFMDWLIDVWKYITSNKDISKHQEQQPGNKEKKVDELDLSAIENWSLLVCQRGNEHYLLQVGKRRSVLYLHLIQRSNASTLKKILREKIHVFEPVLRKEIRKGIGKEFTSLLKLENIYSKGDPGRIFGSLDDGNNLIDAMFLCSEIGSFKEKVTVDDALVILEHLNGFVEEIDDTRKEKLKELPLFETFDGKLTKGVGTVVVLPDENLIPREGLADVERHHNCRFVRAKMGKLLKWLQFVKSENICDFYLTYICSSMAILNDEALFRHFDYIKDNLMHGSVTRLSGYKRFFDVIKTIPFIPQEKNCRKRACELYDPRKELYQLMVDKDKLPPEKYQSDDWKEFLITLGMQKDVTKAQFVEFAKCLESDLRIKSKRKASSLLCVELISLLSKEEEDHTRFVQTIRSISFIVPQPLNRWLESLHPSKNAEMIEAEKLMCFLASGTEETSRLLWTTNPVLPDYAVQSFNNLIHSCPEYLTKLGVQSSINPRKKPLGCDVNHSDVIRHIKNITNCEMIRESSTCKQIPRKAQYTLLAIMDLLFRYFSAISSEALKECSKQLKNTSYILVGDSTKLEIPRKSVLESLYAIPPYLNAVPVNLGRHFEILEKLGCPKKPSPAHYVSVLDEIKELSGDNCLDPNMLKAAKKATVLIAETLRTSNEITGIANCVLYLPTVTFATCRQNKVHLKESSKVIYVDDYHLEGRLKSFSEPLLLMKHNEELNMVCNTNADLMKYLPESRRPKVLSDVIEEQLISHMEYQTVAPDHVSQGIKAQLASPVFLASMERLLKHEKSQSAESSIDAKIAYITKAIRNVEVYVLPDIKTQFFFEDSPIEDSDVSKKLFLKISDNNLQIYFRTFLEKEMAVYSDVADGLLKLFKNPLKDSTTVLMLPQLLAARLENVMELLDHKGIKRGESDLTFSQLDMKPNAGDLVPIELYGSLQDDFVEFEVGEYVALERSDGEDNFYVYAIVVRHTTAEDDSDPLQFEYIVETENGEVKVKAIELYRFKKFEFTECRGEISLIPTNEELYKSYDDIIKEIREQIANASQEDVKAVVRRLYRKWHPDKNTAEHKELATRVFQFLQELLTKINYNCFFDDWNVFVQRDADLHRRYYDSYRSSPSASSNSWPPTFEASNPQPAEARRWFRQAKHDLEAVQTLTSSEWKCFLAHQAAEKALKAAQYLKNSSRSDHHSLVVASNGLNANLESLGSELERMITSSAHIRYPNCWSMPRIPHDVYTDTMADHAVRLAKRILEIVEGLMP